MRSVRLTRKLAASLNGFNLSQIEVGDVLELPDETARMLIAEEWAEPLMRAPTARGNGQVRPARSLTNQKGKRA